jgi:hypothetical protein
MIIWPELTTSGRQSGFAEVISSEKSMGWWLAELQRTRVLPR